MKLRNLSAALMSILFLSSAGVLAATNPPAMGMVTGSKTGTYIAFGKDMARVAAKTA